LEIRLIDTPTRVASSLISRPLTSRACRNRAPITIGADAMLWRLASGLGTAARGLRVDFFIGNSFDAKSSRCTRGVPCIIALVQRTKLRPLAACRTRFGARPPTCLRHCKRVPALRDVDLEPYRGIEATDGKRFG